MQVFPDLEDQVLGALMTIARATRRHADPPLDQGQLWLLRTLHLDPGQRAAELADSCGLDPSTVSRHLRQLEDGGQVRREADPADRRAHRLFLTTVGETVVTAAIEQRRHLLRDRFSRWQPTEVDQLARLLKRLADDLAGPPADGQPPPGSRDETPTAPRVRAKLSRED